MAKQMYVYIMGNDRPTLYTGMTGNLTRRVQLHKEELVEGFTKKYHIHDLLYYEVVEGQIQAIAREKQIKDMNRIDKLKMIKNFNPEFRDLFYVLLNADSGRTSLPE